MAVSGHGYPEGTRRWKFTDGGMRLRDLRRIADPRKEVSAAQFELMLWQAGAFGLLAPLAVLQYEPAAWAGSEKIRYGALAWEADAAVHTNEAAPTWVTVTRVAAGDYKFTFAASATAGDGTSQAIAFAAGLAQPCGLDGTAAPAGTVPGPVLIGLNEARVNLWTPAGIGVDSPVVLVLFGDG